MKNNTLCHYLTKIKPESIKMQNPWVTNKYTLWFSWFRSCGCETRENHQSSATMLECWYEVLCLCWYAIFGFH